MKNLLAYLVLPKEVSAFEKNYLARMNRVGLLFFALHIPFLMAVAFFNDTDALVALGLSTAVFAGPAIAVKTLSNPRSISVLYGFTAMLMGGLLVHFGQGPAQIEMHFYFFALLAMLAVYGNPMVIVVAAVTVALHHVALWLYLPSSVFNYDAPFWVVAIHAAFVVAESVATCYIARSFFENVIGLEKIVHARTQQLDERNADMRAILDTVEQGFLTIDRDAVVSKERSRVVSDWFGPAAEGVALSDYLRKTDAEFSAKFDLGWAEVLEEVMPVELTIDQMPSEIRRDGSHFRVEYKPIMQGESIEKALVVISDVSAEMERRRLEAEQRDVMSVLTHIGRDKQGVLEFFDEGAQQVAVVECTTVQDLATLRRVVHTLKGNAMLFGIERVASVCHEMESEIDERGEAPSPEARAELGERWRHLCGNLETLLGGPASNRLEIDDGEYQALLRSVLRRDPHELVAGQITAWKLEPTARRLSRVADQARGIAQRLNKGAIAVEIDDQQLRLDPDAWASFWSSFVHVIRNAVDHGIEEPETRAALGKAATGRLSLSTRVEAADFVIAVRDDGRGIDWDKVAKKASLLGIPHHNRAELIDALFADGVSTKEGATEYSGRGIGLGAVRVACEELGGTISVESEEGGGTCIEFRFKRETMASLPHFDAVG